MLTASTLSGPRARIEAGVRLTERLSAFGFGEATPQESMAGIGARFTF